MWEQCVLLQLCPMRTFVQQVTLHSAWKSAGSILKELAQLTPIVEALHLAGVTATGAMLMTGSAAPFDVWAVPFALTWLGYAYDRLVDTTTADATPGRAFAIASHRRLLIASLATCACYLVVRAAHFSRDTVLLFAILTAMSVVYTLKFIPVVDMSGNLRLVGLKAIPCGKTVIVGVAYASAGIVAQALLQEIGVTTIGLGVRNFYVGLTFVQGTILSLASDCRDYSEDLRVGVRTLTTVLGLRNASIFGELVTSVLCLACSLAAISGKDINVELIGWPISIGIESVALVPGLLGFLILGLIMPHTLFARSGFSGVDTGDSFALETLCYIHHLPHVITPLCLFLWQSAF